MNPERIVIAIDCLTVTGLGARDGARVGRVLTRELTRLVTDRGLPAGLRVGGDTAALRLPALPPAARHGPEPLGRALAGALYETLDRPRERTP